MSITRATVQVEAMGSLDVHRSVELSEWKSQSSDSAFFHADRARSGQMRKEQMIGTNLISDTFRKPVVSQM